ncbi:hypothetical protein An02g12200 [Aspergillus niger]|uniref:Uncharacterized protein n=2 Tax=Aspergillus niger TaxID=5061 RepID=A2QET7_ASPNC|nr:hypothetical protein An02g12200 [Aspergillus niger]CAK37901.1 hypothetical protein An02g12200 [Aspergillus niger]
MAARAETRGSAARKDFRDAIRGVPTWREVLSFSATERRVVGWEEQQEGGVRLGRVTRWTGQGNKGKREKDEALGNPP